MSFSGFEETELLFTIYFAVITINIHINPLGIFTIDAPTTSRRLPSTTGKG